MYWGQKSDSSKSAALRLMILVASAIGFGWCVSFFSVKGSLDFFAGYITEYSLSIDNLFVYSLLLKDLFKVPAELSNWSLSIGIFLSALMRLGLIVLGSSLLSRFSFLFYFCSAFLMAVAVSNAVSFWKGKKEKKGKFWQGLSEILPIGAFKGKKLFYRKGGKLLFSPLLPAFCAIALADAFFSLDSIPAILGITTNTFIVFTSNFFALMGLKELYSLLSKAMALLRFLPLGISLILLFIGCKLFLEALESNSLKFINKGNPVQIPDMPPWVTLTVICAILVLCVIFSLIFPKSKIK